jgi:DNA end-binding protein Ku
MVWQHKTLTWPAFYLQLRPLIRHSIQLLRTLDRAGTAFALLSAGSPTERVQGFTLLGPAQRKRVSSTHGRRRTPWQFDQAGKDFSRFNLISVPVKAYSASVGGRGKIGFHMIHAKCRSRIRYKKVCPVHGEVSNDEIVSGYEYSKGKYVLIDPEELKQLRPGADKSINVDVFIEPGALDPMHYTEQSYYLAPDGTAGEKPYAVLQKVMADEGRYAVATMVFSGREHVVVVRPVQRLLLVTVLSYDAQMKKPALFGDEIPEVHVAAEEIRLAGTLIKASTADHFDFAKYKDEYTSQVKKLIEAMAAGKKIVTEEAQEEPAVINQMDALRQSLGRAKHKSTAKHPGEKGARKLQRVAGKAVRTTARRKSA